MGQGACDKVQPTMDGVVARTSSFAAARPALPLAVDPTLTLNPHIFPAGQAGKAATRDSRAIGRRWWRWRSKG